MDASEQRIADSLTRHAADAPSDDNLLSTVHTRLRRRRTSQVVGAAVLAVVVVAAGLGVTQSLRTEPPPAPQPSPAPIQVGPAAPGWRWESYKTAQVQVPADWKQYVASPAPCGTWNEPGVGRFYDWLPRNRYVCEDPVFPLKNRKSYVWFDDLQAPGIKQYDGGWSEETRVVGGMKVTVLAPNETLRRRIIDSARPIGATDAYGCTPTDSSAATEMRTELADGAEICEYFRGSLIASSRVPGRLAAQLGKALLQDVVKPSKSPYQGCEKSDPITYVVKLHSGTRAWTMRQDLESCTTPPLGSLDILRSGPHSPTDPSQMGLPPYEVVPPQR